MSRTKDRGRRIVPYFPALLIGVGHLIFSGTRIYWLPGSQVFGLELKYTTGFPGSPSCRWQNKGFLSLHNYVKLILHNKSPYICVFVSDMYTHTHTHTYHWFSGELWHMISIYRYQKTSIQTILQKQSFEFELLYKNALPFCHST